MPEIGRFPDQQDVFIEGINRKVVGEEVRGGGLMKYEELKLEQIEVPHTVGG